MDTEDLAKKAAYGQGDVHMLQPSAVTVTQVSEMGTIYSLDELKALKGSQRSNRVLYIGSTMVFNYDLKPSTYDLRS